MVTGRRLRTFKNLERVGMKLASRRCEENVKYEEISTNIHAYTFDFKNMDFHLI